MPPMVNASTSVPEWRLLQLSYESAFENLALEETLARTVNSKTDPTVRFWSNVPAVVLGRFQEASAEADLAICESRKVQVARRFTGGGAVFHDKGTLNFTIITQPELGLNVSALHEKYSDIVIDSLRGLKVDCSFSPPNSVLIGGRKVFGAAAALGAHFALWHGSVLVSTDTRTLEEVLAPSRRKMPTRFVRSQWKPVTTIEAAMGRSISIEEVQARLLRSLKEGFGIGIREVGLLPAEEDYLQRLLSRKYSLAQWNLYGNRFQAENKESVE